MRVNRLPKWVEEIPNRDEMYVDFWLSTALVKMQGYAKRAEIYRDKYGVPFDEFSTRVLSAKKENLPEWDDYIVWKGIEEAKNLWLNRYEELRQCAT